MPAGVPVGGVPPGAKVLAATKTAPPTTKSTTTAPTRNPSTQTTTATTSQNGSGKAAPAVGTKTAVRNKDGTIDHFVVKGPYGDYTEPGPPAIGSKTPVINKDGKAVYVVRGPYGDYTETANGGSKPTDRLSTQTEVSDRAKSPSVTKDTFKIQSGDTLGRIAKGLVGTDHFKGKSASQIQAELVKINHISDPNKINAGANLNLVG